MDFITGPSGGLAYHAAAFRYRKSRWTPFIDAVEGWLTRDWNPDKRDLIIFGTSAGWTLPPKFLARFETITAVEPDPVARFLFRRRFAPIAPQLRFVTDPTLLPWFTRDANKLKTLFDERPQAAILFSNLLGQIPLLIPSTRSYGDTQRSNKTLLAALDGRSWASYHDLISSTQQCKPGAPTQTSNNPSLQEIAALFYPSGEVTDHDTLWLSEGRAETRYAVWEIRPHRRHVIAFVHSN